MGDMTQPPRDAREAANLLPCPFCGNDGKGAIEDALHVAHSELEWRASYDSYCVQCDKCTATMGYSDSEDEAITAWNTRPEPDAEIEALRAENARLREALERVLPYTEAERLAEASAVRCGATRDPINKAVLFACEALNQEPKP